jgi:arginyl-tRNA synthetase
MDSMRILAELRRRFRSALEGLAVENAGELLAMVKPAQDSKFGDYQANCAMPLGKQLGRPPREIAAELISRLDLGDLCEPPEIAGPGFINVRLKDDWLATRLNTAFADGRLGVEPVETPRTYIVDFSSPNVAKPMHVGHIRSTVIGDAIYRILKFLGHRAIADNHLGDWGTQFGMIIYGYKHFVDRSAYQATPVEELARLYKLVNRLVEYQNDKHQLPALERLVTERKAALAAQRSQPAPDKAATKKAGRAIRKLESQCAEATADVDAARQRQAAVEADTTLREMASQHAGIARSVLEETAKLHAGDEANQSLWEEFLPKCRDEIQRVYDRLQVQFDQEHGESFYHDRLAGVVDAFETQGLARVSDGAICVFLDGFETPMIIRKQDGAFLYATTDLATIQYRMEALRPDTILYVVDHRQSEHFEKLFAAARLWGFEEVDLRHISFGTVLGEDGRPYKTRSGDTVGLEGLLDEAVRRAWEAFAESDQQQSTAEDATDEQRRQIANVVGHGAIKYADLSHNRTSDYVFSYDKMLALSGNTATYMQYSYARVRGIFNKGGVEPGSLGSAPFTLTNASERELALRLLQFADALDETVEDFRPNQLTSYLFDLTKGFFSFYENCQVLKVEDPELRTSRLALCDLTGRTIKQGLDLLGIEVVDRM